jgi:hypothetical protein
VGLVAAVNTAGGIAGSLLTGFVLVPRLGLVRSIGVLAVTGAALAAIAVLKSGRPGRRPAGTCEHDRAGRRALATLVRATGWRRCGRESVADGCSSTRSRPAARWRSSSNRRGPDVPTPVRPGRLELGDAPASLRYMRLQALLPLLVHRGEPRTALVVGFGTGITAGRSCRAGARAARRRRAAASVVRAGALFAGNLGASTDRRLEIRIGDGRHELLRRSERYDVITLEPPPPSAAGVVNLYSRDFYELAASATAAGRPDGAVVAAAGPERRRLPLARAQLPRRVPHASAWTTELHEVLLVGSLSPLELSGARDREALGAPEVQAALAEVGIESAAALLATWVTDRAGLERYAGDARPVTDDRPRIEHAAWVRRGEIERVLPRLLELASDVPLPPRSAARAGRSGAPGAARLLPLLAPTHGRRQGRRRNRAARGDGPRSQQPLLPVGGLRR